MLQNNIEMDMKMRMIEDSVTQTELAERLGISVAYVNRITKGREQIVNKTFIRIMEQLGYDVELTYVRRKE
ncbi:MAG: helix-turn-helix transcriptional regulator [Atopobiaceae bacterium]|jgi:plasmid maintenance system antidote protein VapI|nr:helix-turn-helix transcriptional regulator [Atopobiaceae bacterium]